MISGWRAGIVQSGHHHSFIYFFDRHSHPGFRIQQLPPRGSARHIIRFAQASRKTPIGVGQKLLGFTIPTHPTAPEGRYLLEPWANIFVSLCLFAIENTHNHIDCKAVQTNQPGAAMGWRVSGLKSARVSKRRAFCFLCHFVLSCSIVSDREDIFSITVLVTI
jgi:hypothetical protein